MKTNVTMYSTDRKLFGVTIKQETKTSFLNLSDLQEAYTHARIQYGWADRGKIQDILTQKENLERIYYLLDKQGFINSGISEFMESVEKEGSIKTLKSLGVYRTTGRGDNKAVFCNPYIWVLAAMELNPMIYAEVVTWLTDNLILNRIEAGNFYKELSAAIYKWNPDYKKIAILLNYIVFNKHITGIRNFASEHELKELRDLESKLAFSINMGYITSEENLVNELTKIYNSKYTTQLPNETW